MRAVHYLGDRRLDVAAVEPASPGPGQVRIDVAYTGICGTDLHVLAGHMDSRVTFPAVMGHEMSGRIAEIGDDVQGWAIGDAVTVIPIVSCGDCPACHAGNGHICHNIVFLGIDADGAMQGSWTVPGDTLVRLPDRMGLDVGALVEPLAVAVHDVERAGVARGDRVLVIGGGPVGLLIAHVATHYGGEVLLSEPSQVRRAMAEETGIRTVDPQAHEVPAFVETWTGGAGADVAIEVSGSEAGVTSAVASLKVRGRLALVGVHTEPRPMDLFRFFWRELDLVGARLYTRSDYETAVALIEDGNVDVARLISRIEPMDNAHDAFEALESGEVMKVLIDCQR